MRRTFVWLLLVAAYGLFDSNAKWQEQSDQVLINFGLEQCHQFPQLFFKRDGNLILVVAKFVDDNKVMGQDEYAKYFLQTFNVKFKLGNITSGPFKMRCFGINVLQEDYIKIKTNAEDKSNSLADYFLSRRRQNQFGSLINSMERAHYASTNSSFQLLRTAVSLFCSLYASYLQKKTPETNVIHLVEQINVIRKIKRLGTFL